MAGVAADTVSLTVAEALPKDVGRGIARMDPDDMTRLGVGAGDIVEAGPRRQTGLRAMPTYPEQRGQRIIQIDGISRSNAQAALGEVVEIKACRFDTATAVILTPASAAPAFGTANGSEYLARVLEGLPVTSGDRVRATLMGGQYREFTVTDSAPNGVVLIGPRHEDLRPGGGRCLATREGRDHLRGRGRPPPRARADPRDGGAAPEASRSCSSGSASTRPRASCSTARRARARRSSRGPSPTRPMPRSSTSAGPRSSTSSTARARRTSAPSSRRPGPGAVASSSSTRSTPSRPSARTSGGPGRRAARGRPAARPDGRPRGARPGGRHRRDQPPRRRSTRRCAGPAVSTGRSRSTSPTDRAASSILEIHTRGMPLRRTSTSTGWPRSPMASSGPTLPRCAARPRWRRSDGSCPVRPRGWPGPVRGPARARRLAWTTSSRPSRRSSPRRCARSSPRSRTSAGSDVGGLEDVEAGA